MTNFDNLLQNALVALAAGRTETARRLLLSFVSACPENEKGWLYLAVALPREQSVQALQRVLVINPYNKQALRSLKLLRQNPKAQLDLADVLLEIEENERQVFGNEPPTIPEGRLSSLFTNEPPTMPAAFQSVLTPKPMGTASNSAEPGVISSLLEEEWTAHPFRTPVPKKASATSEAAPPAPPKTSLIKPLKVATAPAPIKNLSPSFQTASADFPVSSLQLEPQRKESTVARFSSEAKISAEDYVARRVQTAPFFNINVPLPKPKPSTARRYRRVRSSAMGLTWFGYLLLWLIILAVILYLYFIINSPVPLNNY